MAVIWKLSKWAILGVSRFSIESIFILSMMLMIPLSVVAVDKEDAQKADIASVPFEAARNLFESYCRNCHIGPDVKGDFRLTDLHSDFTDRKNRDLWESLALQLQSGTMPPAKKPRPPADNVKQILDWIGGEMAAAQVAEKAGVGPVPGRVLTRRLTRTEYINTIRDLLKVDIDLTDLLPAETNATGFETRAETLHVSSHLLESYMAAADRAIDAAIASAPRPRTFSRRYDIKNERSIRPNGSVYRHLDDGVAIFATSVPSNIQVTLWQYMTRARGRYRFRISGYGYQTEKPIAFHVKVGPMNAAAQQQTLGYFDLPAGAAAVVEFERSIDPEQTIRIVADGLRTSTREVEKIGVENYTGPGLVIQWVEIEGPLIENWPPPSHKALFGDLPQRAIKGAEGSGRVEVISTQPLVEAERILTDFARRAFRRPVTASDMAPVFSRVRDKLEKHATFEEAVRIGLRAVLLSPDFLFLKEPAGKADAYALASRLSYFLWSSMPDDALYELAGNGQLHNPATLHEQVERMLNDSKAVAFTENFAGQWLGLGAIDATMPDPTLYPEFDDILKDSCVRETLLFFDEILKNDLSLTNFVSSDFAMLNGRMAEHYGISGVEGMAFRKVPVPPDGRRGGLLTMTSILKVTAKGTTTSPVLRGAWVLERILGTPPPKPTAEIEAVEPDIRGATTIREQLALHRERVECASCHAVIDPPGFALESYDVIGGWRDRYRSIGAGDPVVVDGRRMRYRQGPIVDPSYRLSDGREFRDIGGYKQLLLSDKASLARALAAKLLAYATGSEPGLAERAEIEAIVARLQKKGYGLRSLIHEVALSPVFQGRGIEQVTSPPTPEKTEKSIPTKRDQRP